MLESLLSNGRKAKSCSDRVFNFKLDRFGYKAQYRAMTHSKMTFNIMTLTIQGLLMTLTINDTYHNNIVIMLNVAFYLLLCCMPLCWASLCWRSWRWMSLCSVNWRMQYTHVINIFFYNKRNAECHYAEWSYAEWPCACSTCSSYVQPLLELKIWQRFCPFG